MNKNFLKITTILCSLTTIMPNILLASDLESKSINSTKTTKKGGTVTKDITVDTDSGTITSVEGTVTRTGAKGNTDTKSIAMHSDGGINDNATITSDTGETVMTKSTYGTKQNVVTVRDTTTGGFEYTNVIQNSDGTTTINTGSGDEGYGQVNEGASTTTVDKSTGEAKTTKYKYDDNGNTTTSSTSVHKVGKAGKNRQ